MKRGSSKQGRRRRFFNLLAAVALLIGAVGAGSGCAVHAHAPIPIRLRTVSVRLPPPPPPRAERCAAHEMCNIWGICRTRVVCTPVY